MSRGIADIMAENDAAHLANQVHDTIKRYHDIAMNALEKSAMTKEEVKAEVVNEYAEENAGLRRQLSLSVARLHSDKELEAYDRFVSEHDICRSELKINHGKMPYVIQIGTGIGTCTKVCCQVCGATEDITDVSVW